MTDPVQTARRTPHSTYRLQVSPDFTLFDAAGVLPYLHDLGVDWVYLSPLLASEPGSTHGYDVVAFDHVDVERGGEEGLAAVSAEARRLGMGVLVDIVPNHVGVATPSEDPWWWDVLKLGRESEHANAFDVDWAAGDGRLVIPVIGDDDEDAIRIAVSDSGQGEVRYHDQRFPLAPGTTTLEEQHYELVNWRAADEDLNYRRFFAVNTLAAVRVEDPEVFAETHAEIKRWFDEGLVDGLRVDHPDGLRDPKRYLDDLAALTGGAYVLVEKILEPGEELLADWATDGTTGLRRPRAHRPRADRPGRRGAADRARGPAARGARRLAPDGPRQQARRRRRHPALRGPADHPRGGEGRRGGGRGRRRRRDRRAARLLPGLPLLPPRGPRPPRPGLRRRPRVAPRARGDVRRPRAGAPRRVGPAGPASPADLRHGDGQGRRGLLVLPVVATHLAQRGRRRPVDLRSRRRHLPRRDGRPPARLARRDGHALHPRHQARRGRPCADHRAGRGAGPLGAGARRAAAARARARPGLRLAAVAGRARCLDPRPPARPARAAPRLRREGDARGRRPHDVDRARRDVRGRGARRGRRRLRHRRRARGAARPRRADRRAGAGELARRQAARDHHPGRARRLPGQRAVGDLARRPRQPSPGGLRAPQGRARRHRRGRRCHQAPRHLLGTDAAP